MIDVDAAMAYLGFVEARHEAYLNRQAGLAAPWTNEPIVQAHKFTNVFRILDHGTQFILSDLAEPGLSDRDLLMRLFLYRHTGRVEAWQYLDMTVGYPVVANLPEALAAWLQYPSAFFTNAYLVYPQSHVKGTNKIESIVDLASRLFTEGSEQDVVPDFLAAQTQKERFQVLRRNKGVGDFMSMQVLTDWGYTANCGEDREDEFIVLGPGALKGAAALDPSAKPMDVFKWAVESVRQDPPLLALDEVGEGYRAPSYMDLQNTLCEFSKHSRFASKPEPTKPYTPAHPGPQPKPLLPQHW